MKKLPNMITLLRVVLSLFLNFYIVAHYGSILIPIIISFIIFLTDFLDGKIARINRSVSNVGAVLDVVADLFYIVVSYIVLYTFHILSLWFLFIIIFKFVEFVITSYFIKKISNQKSIFVFDFVGRYVAVIFYIIPLVSYVSFQFLQTKYLSLINALLYIITFIVFVSSSYRIGNCIKGFKSLNSESLKKKYHRHLISYLKLLFIGSFY